jgi:hypothetical protein
MYYYYHSFQYFIAKIDEIKLMLMYFMLFIISLISEKIIIIINFFITFNYNFFHLSWIFMAFQFIKM